MIETVRNFLVRAGLIFYRRYMKGTKYGRVVAHQIIKRGLINAADLHISALSADRIKTENFPAIDVEQVEINLSVPGFHLSLPLNFEVHQSMAMYPFINILIPSLRQKHMSGGPNTALLLAAMLAQKGQRIRLISCDSATEGEEAALYKHMELLHQHPVDRNMVQLVDGFDRTKPIEIGPFDIFFATAWWTAQIAKYAVRKTVYQKFIYLIQDFEAVLHNASTFQARALETYGIPHIPVINTELLFEHMVQEKIGFYADPVFAANALRFEPALDRLHYYPDDTMQAGRNGKKTLLFYARPNVAHRNLFEIGVVALRQAVASGAIDKDNWEIWAMGERMEPVALGKDVFLNPLPWMDFANYSKRVRTADIMLSLMHSPHPSYPPLEMAASGKLVVTSVYSVKTAERLKTISPNIIAVDPSADKIGAALITAVGRLNAGFASLDPTGTISLPSNWDDSLGRIVPQLLQQMEAFRTEPRPKDAAKAKGFPVEAKSKYEAYRRDRLSLRRERPARPQVTGLLSFVTSAYNTDKVFLEQLAGSIFQQDGGMNFEWLILDNGSTDIETRKTLEEIGRFPGVRLERVNENLGIIGGMRFLLERATGRYVLPLDSDDIVEPDCINVLTQFIEDNNYPALLYTDEDKFAGDSFASPYLKPDWDPVLFLHSCYIAHLCAIDREAALRLGLYTDKNAEGCHDWDSFIRFMQAGYVPCHVAEVLYGWRIHAASTSGNITSKSYITSSHRATLQNVLNQRNIPNLQLVTSPLFDFNVDWWYRRNADAPLSYSSIVFVSGEIPAPSEGSLQDQAVIDTNADDVISRFSQAVEATTSELIHLRWDGIKPDDDGWRQDATGLMELFPDTVMVGGTLHDGGKVVGGPLIFGFGGGYDCPDAGRSLSDPGYFATMWKAHSVSAVSSGHCVVRREFLVEALKRLVDEEASIYLLGPWLGGLAAEHGKRVVFSPFMRARAKTIPESRAGDTERAAFLSRFWNHLPEERFYSRRLGLSAQSAYAVASDNERSAHMEHLQSQLLAYPAWLAQKIRARGSQFPTPALPAKITVITPVYSGSDLALLDELARSIGNQSHTPAEWIIVVNGAMPKASMDLIEGRAASGWNARLIIEEGAIGIVQALYLGLKSATSEYVVPIDADDLLTADAIQILTHEIHRTDEPDLLFSDEDIFVDGMPCSPYLRSEFDPVLSLDNSVIWHLCAMKRSFALKAAVYTESAANWCQDWDTVSRISAAGGKIVHIQEVLYHWRQHAGSTTNNSKGDSRSLDSVRHILERHIEKAKVPANFEVAPWPVSRGADELYIARKSVNLPEIIWYDEAGSRVAADDAIVVFAANGISIPSTQAFLEAVRLFELHPDLAAVGGLVLDKNDIVVDGCWVANEHRELASPWVGQRRSFAGPYALAQKPQSVALTGHSLALFRSSALSTVEAPYSDLHDTQNAVIVCGHLIKSGWKIAYSPLILGQANSTYIPNKRVPGQISDKIACHALTRYGASRSFKS